MAKALQAGKLIIGAIAVSVDPTGMAATGLGIDTTLQLMEWFKPKSDLAKLSKEIDKQFQTELKSDHYAKPDDARTVLPQMLADAFPTGQQFAECGLVAGDILKEMHKRLGAINSTAKRVEYQRLDIVPKFDKLILPLLTTACDDPRLVAALQPALIRAGAKSTAKRDADTAVMKGTLDAILAGQNTATMPLEDLIALATEFGEHSVTDRVSLTKFLTLKAEEYRDLKREVGAINEDMKRLANLKAAAQDAIDRVDLDEVENILSMVQETELEEAAKTAELRANNALLRGKDQQAFDLLESAANSFGAIGGSAKAERKIGPYFHILYDHGLRYGGHGLRLASDLIAPELTKTLKSENPTIWGDGKNNRALALQNRGTRTSEPDGAELLAQSVTAYRDALQATPRADHPVDWAVTQNNLANALASQGTRTSGPEGADLLAQAVTAYREALQVYTRADHPVHWAMTQNNLGAALQIQGTRTSGPDGADLLAQSVTAFRDALQVRTRADHPVDWAITQKNIAIALQAKATHDSATDTRADLNAALAAVDDVLRVLDPVNLSFEHASATEVRDEIRAQIAALD